jgi:hypothetical protein
MPAESQSQLKLIYAKRGIYKTKENTPEKWKWVWDKEWTNVKMRKLPKKVKKEDFSSSLDNYIDKNLNIQFLVDDLSKEKISKENFLTEIVKLNLSDDEIDNLDDMLVELNIWRGIGNAIRGAEQAYQGTKKVYQDAKQGIKQGIQDMGRDIKGGYESIKKNVEFRTFKKDMWDNTKNISNDIKVAINSSKDKNTLIKEVQKVLGKYSSQLKQQKAIGKENIKPEENDFHHADTFSPGPSPKIA